MKEIYKIENYIEKIRNGNNTLFLDNKEFKILTSKLKKNEYNIYYPYKDSEKVILYVNKIPNVSLFKIICNDILKHQDILGSIMALNISSSYLGDIIIDNNNYYFYILDELSDYIKYNLTKIGNKNIKLELLDIDSLSNYERKYEELELIVSSIRIDNILSSITNLNRKVILDRIKSKEVILNYEILTKNSYNLKENDVFSIRKYGKYKYIGIIKNTKKGNLIIKCLKYI